MAWRIELPESTKKQLASLDRQNQKRIITYLRERLACSENPRTLGKPLIGPRLGAYWRYRVGDYRLICAIHDDIVTIVVVEIGNRREVYR